MFLYLILPNNEYEWEDLLFLDNEEEAIEYSLKYPNIRIEIFYKNDIDNTNKLYKPTYNYYKNGKLYGLNN